jgi:glycosidase
MPVVRQGKLGYGMVKIFRLLMLTMLSLPVFAQEIRLERVEPPSWWTGFKNPDLQLLIYGKNIGTTVPSINYPGVELKQVHVMNNPNWLFLDISISPTAKAGSVPLSFSINGKLLAGYLFNLQKRKVAAGQHIGFSSSDVIYLLMPDRFANSDTANDNRQDMVERAERINPDGRHGGDLKGITGHLDYLRDLGVTAVWSTPLLENNMQKYSYHGYSITDYYKIDPRFGTNEDYRTLADELHKRGMKLIMDMVFNHCGTGHWWMKDPPAKDWFNEFPEFTRTSYRSSTVSDPYRSQFDSIRFLKGWFDKTMPDLNQENPYVANYLIQNSIWWIEYAGLDGIRQDTYPYSFKDFMSRWNHAVMNEYPDFNIVGECWHPVPAGIAYWQKDAVNRDKFNSLLPSVFDFALFDALRHSFMEKDGWSTGISKLYDILSQDFVYPDPSHIVIFADNHDADRYLASQDQDIRKLKMAMAFVLTTRGIPEICWGTEILLTTGSKKGDGYQRMDFPGGWPGDTINGFTGKGLSKDQADMQNYMRKLLNWRKNKEVIHSGNLKHFVPTDGIYVYFRYDQHETIMVAMNNNENENKKLDNTRYDEFLNKYKSAIEVITGKTYNDLSQIIIPPKTALIFELK